MRTFMRRHWLMSLFLLGALIGLGWFLTGRQGDKTEIPAVKADNRVLAEGIVFPVKYAQMVMPVDGTIGEISVKEGDQVQAGQSLIRLVRQDYEARVGSASADVARSAALLEQARVNLADAERELQRQEQLAAIGAVSRQQLDQARTTMARNRAAVAQAQADMLTQQGRLDEAGGQLEKTELKAPISGNVAYLDVKPGEHATIGTVLIRLADESAWEVRSDDLTELSIAKIRVGGAVSLTFDGIPGLDIPGKVKFIRPFGEKKRGDITYTVTVAPERWDERLRWNMTAQMAISPSR
ncbi:efflux RND transporter periplasmic adaptor subunit [bacterium BFN5]|nr:efflux RND transporter periplasmic adaptor subunit [bacterium BFN5]QJW49048.1 efflux RND transporter periplasmic adaptor subunit [bacterium BFN5]